MYTNQDIVKVITQWSMMVVYGFFGGTTFIAAWMETTSWIFINISMGVAGAFMLCEAGIIASKILGK